MWLTSTCGSHFWWRPSPQPQPPGLVRAPVMSPPQRPRTRQVLQSIFSTAKGAPLTHEQPANTVEKRQSVQPFTTYNKTLATSPPFYPSPWGSGAGNWSAAYEKARAFVSQLTLLEKVNLTTGVGFGSLT